MTINNTVQGRWRVLLCDFSLGTPKTCKDVERGSLGTGDSVGHEMFKGEEVLETTVQKSRPRDSKIRNPRSPRALATMVGVKGQEAPVKSQA